MTQERISAAEFRRRLGLPINHENRDPRQIQNPKPKCHEAPALGGSIQGEAGRVQRTRICFTGHRVKLLDPDNFAGSVKDLLDGLRHAGLIPDDTSDKITLETEQVKVPHFDEEMTKIEIEIP